MRGGEVDIMMNLHIVWKGRNGWHQDVREMTKNEMLSVGLIIISPQLGFDENDVI